jgi:DNA-binding NarL/FixJ family response regulator
VLGLSDGLEVVGRAENGRAAIQMTTATDPDVVVMDVHMPLVDGLDATRLIRSLSDAAIILLTSAPSPRVARLARAFGASAFLSKDIDPFELIDCVYDVDAQRARTQLGRQTG